MAEHAFSPLFPGCMLFPWFTVIIDIPSLLIRISYIRLLKYQLTCSRPRAVSLLFMWDVLLFFLFLTTFGLSCLLFAQIRLIACLYFQAVCQSVLVGLFLLHFPNIQCGVHPLVAAGTELFGIPATLAKLISYAGTIGLKQKSFWLVFNR